MCETDPLSLRLTHRRALRCRFRRQRQAIMKPPFPRFSLKLTTCEEDEDDGLLVSSPPSLTGDVVVPPPEELQTPQVGAELLKLEGELHVLLGLVAVQQRRVGLVDAAALQLALGHQVDPVELLFAPAGVLGPGAHDVHLVPDLRVEQQPPTGTESAKGEERRRGEREKSAKPSMNMKLFPGAD